MTITASPSNHIKTLNVCPEIDFLLCCIRKHFSPSTTAHAAALVEQHLDWDYLIRLAKFHKVTPSLYQNLNRLFPQLIPGRIAEQLQTLVYANTYRNFFLTRELLSILKLFEHHEIPTIPFKGIMLAIAAYQDLSCRQISDLDLLLPASAIASAQELLRSKGFQLTGNYGWEFHFYRPEGNVHVDLHQEISPKFYGLPYNFEQLWARAQSLQLGGESIQSLTVEDHLLLLSLVWCRDCTHLNSHFSLHLLCDAHGLIVGHPQLDWDWLFQEVQTLGCDRILRLLMTSARNLLGTDLPETVVERLIAKTPPTALTEFIEFRLFSTLNRTPAILKNSGFWEFLWSFNHLFYIGVRERFPDKIKYCWNWFWMCLQVVVTPNEADRNLLILPKPLFFLYYPLHVLRLCIKYVLKILRSWILQIRSI
jgi:hypothetical protein